MCVPVEISPAAPSVIVGPLNSVKVFVPPLAEVVSIEISVPPLAGVTVAAAKAELGAKKPPTINAAAANTKNDVLKTFKLSLTRERETKFEFYFCDLCFCDS